MSLRYLLLVLAVTAVLWLARRTRSAARGPGAGGAPGASRAGGEITSREQALGVLGLEEGATREEIMSSYRELMKRLHPDRPGGSTYLAAMVNDAKELLLR